MMQDPSLPSDNLTFRCGATMQNRFMLAPMTNCQSNDDGTLGDDEFHWLTMRAKGSFGLTMTCAAHVQAVGRGFPGQLGIFSDAHIEGHSRLAAAIRAEGSLGVIQLHHAGMRSPIDLIGETPICPSADDETGARAMSLDEVRELRDDFIAAALRAKRAGYDGVEIHGAHGYILGQFLSSQYNQRTDDYGGTLENRSRIIFEILRGIRTQCGEDFLLGLRLSPERFGMLLSECKRLAQDFIDSGLLDFIDISLWDAFKLPVEPEHQEQPLLEHFASLERGDVRMTVAGKIKTAAQVQSILEAGIDFVSIGRAGILHHDFPERVITNPNFEPTPLPVSRSYLAQEGLSETFIDYMTKWKGFVQA